MRENRLAKLAGLKKLARIVGLVKSEIDKNLALSYQPGFYEAEGGAILYLDANKKWYVAANEVGKITGITADKFTPVGDNEVYDVISSTPTTEASNKFRTYRDKAKLADKSPADNKVKTPTSGRGGAQATTGYTALTAAPGIKLEEVGTDGRSYVYTIISPSSFSYTVDDSALKTVTTSYRNWNDAAKKLNTLEADRRNKAATPATPTPAVTAPAVPAEAPAATTLDQALVQKVAAVLQKAEFTPLNIKSGGNEMDQIKSLKSVVGGLIQLAAIIVLRVGDSLTTLPAARSSDITSGTRKDLAVNMGGRFASDVGIILRQVNDITKIRNQSKAEFQKLVKSVSITQGAQSPAPAAPATTTTPAAAPATGAATATDASLNKKFIKAATLRRLKIRSQMEAAIDSSAQMGRARVS